jgi:molybdopterin adenylyltransferase
MIDAWRVIRATVPVDESLPLRPVRIALLTISDTRTSVDDRSGDILQGRVEAAGHVLADRALVRDSVEDIVARLHGWCFRDDVEVIITTGGTGVTGRDVTPEALHRLDGKDIPGFGELFRWLSFAKIGTSTIQSRACAVVAHGTYIFALPGSTGAVQDGWDDILVHQLDSRHRPCNFADLLARLSER